MLTSWLQRWPQLSAISIIDILIVAALIYQVLVLIKGTRAVQVLVGIAVLALAFYWVRRGQLITVNWLISNALPYAVFALIVVFQNEIRHALAKMGRKLTFSANDLAEGEAYDDIVLAANLFAQSQTGALIVI